jgi:CRP-like cAMP-binding protein
MDPLSAVSLFEGLAKEELAAIRAAAVVRHVGAGEEMRSSAELPAVIAVLRGTFRVNMVSPAGQVVSMRTVHAGDWVGAYALLAGVAPHHVHVSTEGPGELLEISGDAMRGFIRTMPGLCHAMLNAAARTIVSLTDRIFELTTLCLRDRLILELLRLSKRASGARDPVALCPAPTHLALANVVGATREAVSRELRALCRAGVLDTGRGRITIASRRALYLQMSQPAVTRLANGFDTLF